MKLNRRNTLIGLGTIVAGGGAALGTGAFSSVEATRTVNIETDADEDALLQIEANDDYNGTEDDYVTVDSGEIEIDIGDDTDDDDPGVNTSATTKFTDILKVTNNGSQNVGLSVADVNGVGSGELLDFEISDNSIVGDSESNAEDLGKGSFLEITIVINTDEDTDSGDFPGEITFIARAENHST